MPITLNGTTGITDVDGGTVLSTADIATQAQAEAGTDNTKVMTPLRVDQAVAAQVGGVIAGLAAGAIGSYAFMGSAALSTTPIVAGDLIAGSSLRYAAAAASAIAGSALATNNPASTVVPSGTWRAMGDAPHTSNVYRVTLFMRVS